MPENLQLKGTYIHNTFMPTAQLPNLVVVGLRIAGYDALYISDWWSARYYQDSPRAVYHHTSIRP